jgi:hypothetical protein
MDQGKICLKDKYPAYIGWETFERIQAMVHDNYSEYDRNQSRGVPRPGKALLHGIVYCGECGHKMVVQYKKGSHYICDYLRQQYRVPVCQDLPADPIDVHVVRAFLDALAPAELDLYRQAVAALHHEADQVERAQRQQIDRLRYQAHLAERQYNQADPDNRLVAAELERRWEAALRELQEAEERFQRQRERPQTLEGLSPDEREASLRAGRTIPELWRQGRLSPQQQKAFLRSLIDTVVVHRSAPDTLQVRIVWRGGDTTAAAVRVTVGSLARLSSAEVMEKEVLRRAAAGESDEEVAATLTRQGHRSPRHTAVLPSTVRLLRLRHRLFRKRSQSHPRRIPGRLTVSQVARGLGITPHWIYDRIHNGTIQVVLDPDTGLYLFPDQPKTITQFQQLRAGELQKLRF